MTYTEAKSAIEAYGKDDLADALTEHGEEIVAAAIACDVQLSDISEAYAGEWPSDEAFVQNMLEDLGEIPKNFPGYIHIDWEHTAREVMMDYSEDNGHYFRNL